MRRGSEGEVGETKNRQSGVRQRPDVVRHRDTDAPRSPVHYVTLRQPIVAEDRVNGGHGRIFPDTGC